MQGHTQEVFIGITLLVLGSWCYFTFQGTVEDFDVIIQRIDKNSKLRMTEGGTRPANPFPDEKSFEESLEMTYFPGFQVTEY